MKKFITFVTVLLVGVSGLFAREDTVQVIMQQEMVSWDHYNEFISNWPNFKDDFKGPYTMTSALKKVEAELDLENPISLNKNQRFANVVYLYKRVWDDNTGKLKEATLLTLMELDKEGDFYIRIITKDNEEDALKTILEEVPKIRNLPTN